MHCADNGTSAMLNATKRLVSTEQMMTQLLHWTFAFGTVPSIDGVATDAYEPGSWGEVAAQLAALSAPNEPLKTDSTRNTTALHATSIRRRVFRKTVID